MKATKIIKYLTESGIKYVYNVNIVITLETDCIWVNGYNEKMHYNKALYISQNKYKTYFLTRRDYKSFGRKAMQIAMGKE